MPAIMRHGADRTLILALSKPNSLRRNVQNTPVGMDTIYNLVELVKVHEYHLAEVGRV